MQDIDFPNWSSGRGDIHSNDLVVLREELKEGSAHLSESDDNDAISFLHCLASLEKCSSS